MPVVRIVFGEVEALLLIVIFPETVPVAFGANITVRFAVCPAEMVAPLTPLATL